MSSVLVFPEDSSVRLECLRLTGKEALGSDYRFELLVHSPQPIKIAQLLGKGCALVLQTTEGSRLIQTVATQVSALVTAQSSPARRYRLRLESPLALLSLRRQTRIYQHQTLPEMISQVLKTAHYPGDIKTSLVETHEKRTYLVQYEETDKDFVQRLCEEEGLYYRFEPGSKAATFVLEDQSPLAPERTDQPLVFAHQSDLTPYAFAAYDCKAHYKRSVGKVTLRAYDPLRPDVKLEGVASQGTALEKATERYECTDTFSTPGDGQKAAQKRLEGLQAQAKRIVFRTNAVFLVPGDAFSAVAAPGNPDFTPLEGKYLVTSLRHEFAFEEERYTLYIEAISQSTPFRLDAVTPRPVLRGLHSAFVTGASGQEIHPDENGRITVRFHWDREGLGDNRSSLPIRVMQPNLPGSMIIPRVGWEVFVGFEDGDPDHPFVLGKTYNAKEPPPFGLPANKTITALASYSSPGGAGKNSIHFDDAAGRQHVAIHAAHNKNTTVTNNLLIQTSKAEIANITGKQSISVSGNQTVSVGQAYTEGVKSQTATVAATQNLFVKGHYIVGVGSETVLIGGALLEKVGNPVTGLRNLAVSGALAGVGSLGTAGTIAAMAGGAVWAGALAAEHGGSSADARNAGIRGALGGLAGLVPGGDSVFASVSSSGVKMPWEPAPPPLSAAAAGGGAGAAASDHSAALGPGPGHRNTVVKGPMIEMIGAASGVLTPGAVNWQTTGASVLAIGGSHHTKTLMAGSKTMGISSETLGSLNIKTKGPIGRKIRGAVSTKVAGSLSAHCSGPYSMSAPSSIQIKIGGSLTLQGSVVVFKCGDSIVAASSSGVRIKATTIKITGASKQSSDTTHL